MRITTNCNIYSCINNKYFDFIFLFILCTAIFILQPQNISFSPGHHGFVSSDHLSIIKNANVKNLLVGFISKVEASDHNSNYFYFNRSPFIFSASMHCILSGFSNNDTKYMYLAFQLMNVIFALTMFFSYKLVDIFLNNKLMSISCVFLTFCGYYFLYYKDLVEENRVGTLFLIILLYSLFSFKSDKKYSRLLVTFSISSLFGEFPVVFFVLASWLIIVVISNTLIKYLMPDETNDPKTLKQILLTSMLCLFIYVGFVSYNIFVESRITKVQFTETSVFKSGLARIGLNNDFNKQHKDALNFSNYITETYKRFTKSVIPYPLHFIITDKTRIIICIITLTILLSFILTLSNKTNLFRSLTVAGTFLLPATLIILGMKGLMTFHDYTITLTISAALLIYLTLFLLLIIITRENNIMVLICLFATSSLFIFSLFSVSNDISAERLLNKDIHEDFINIANRLGDEDVIMFVPKNCYFKDRPSIIPFYFNKFIINLDLQKSNYFISKDKNKDTITESNSVIFLYKKNRNLQRQN